MRTSPSQETAGPTMSGNTDLSSLEQGGGVRSHPIRSETEVVVSFIWRNPLLILTTLMAFVALRLGYPANYGLDRGSSVPSRIILPCEEVFIVDSKSQWVRDLCRDGIEPHPGPVTLPAVQPRRRKKKVMKPAASASSVRGIAKAAARLVLRPKAESANLGSRIGSWVGDKAQKALLAITGFGDYKVSSNTLVGGQTPPTFASGRHCSTICHREFVQNITSGTLSGATTPFTISGTFSINPTSNFFPWLAEVAASFEQYRVKGMVVEFKTTSGDAVSGTNAAIGAVIIATQYNVLAPAFTTQQQMEAYEFCTSCKASESMIHPIECAPSESPVNEFFVDTNFGGDPRFSYLGTTYVATYGQQATGVTLGELWVSYEIELLKPKLFVGVTNPGISTHFSSNTLIADPTAPFSPFVNSGGVTIKPALGSDLPVIFVKGPSGTYDSFSFPGGLVGTFLFSYNLQFVPAGADVYGGGSTLTITAGAAQILNPFAGNLAVGGSAPLPINGSGSSTNSSGFTAIFVLPGSDVTTPVVLRLIGQGHSNTINVSTLDLWIVSMGVKN